MSDKINIDGQEIAIKSVNDQDYISLTDMASQRTEQEPKFVVRNWLRNGNTLLFIEAWEKEYNPNFKGAGMRTFIYNAQDNSFSTTPQKLIKETNSLGLVSKSGRGGGTYAHRDIAFEFATWLSPVFKLNLIKEFQRLRSEEFQRKQIEWNAGRELARLNYPIHTESIKEVSGSLSDKQKPGLYAKEADMLNKIVFGLTAKEWRSQNPEVKGNIRDTATTTQNTILANLESFNSELTRKGASYEARERALGDMALYQLKILNKKYLPE